MRKKNHVQIQRKHFSDKTKKTKKLSDPQRAPLTAPRTYRWPCRYQPILAISSYKQISESHKITVRVYGLVKAEQTITSGRIFHFSSTPGDRGKLCSASLGGHGRPQANTGTHTGVRECVCVCMFVSDRQHFTASIKPVYSIALCKGPSFAAGWEAEE